MGNDTSITSDDKQIENGRLKIEKYPSNMTAKEWIPIEYTLNANQNSECLLLDDEDRRDRAMPNDYKQINDYDIDDDDNKYNDNNNFHKRSALYNIGQIKMKFKINNKIKHFFGSGSIIHHALNKSYVLTVAHNIVIGNDDDECDMAQYVWFQINENQLNGYKEIEKYNCSQCHVHPKYIDYIKHQRKMDKGFDIAIIEIVDKENILKKSESLKMRHFKSEMDYKQIKVIGFPGEQSLNGQLYGMRGTAILDGSRNNKIKYENIDTTGGQSGCPIFRALENNNDNIYESFQEIIGVHTFGNKIGYNAGTLINDDILKWIHTVIDGDCIERDDYDCYALLITSSKAKYAKCLNKIYKKCQNTKAINTMRLYYDYDDGDKEIKNVQKSDILYWIDNMFNNDNKRTSYLLYFCGESDENGNWIINDDENDVITLDDIAMCAKQNHHASRLFIVSDCDKSGDWIKKYKNNHQDFQIISAIQASSKYQKACKPGIFTSKYAQSIFEYNKKNIRTASVVGGVIGAGMSGLIVGTLYDGIIKQPFHRTTKYSQPTSTEKSDYGSYITNDGKYDVRLCFYNSWYDMDLNITCANSAAVISLGAEGLY